MTIIPPGAQFAQGTLASRPTAGAAGRVYLATDTQEFFYDNGSAWLGAGGVPDSYSKACLIAEKSTTFTPSANTWTTITSWQTPLRDVGNNFNTSTGLYTCPVTGLYHCDFMIKIADGTSSNMNFMGSVNKADLADRSIGISNIVGNPNGSTRASDQLGRLQLCTAGDQLRLQCFINGSSSITQAIFHVQLIQAT